MLFRSIQRGCFFNLAASILMRLPWIAPGRQLTRFFGMCTFRAVVTDMSEIRPGNYVFLDATACRLGIATLNDLSLGVVTTVVSVNDRYCIIDAGSKVLSSDAGPHGTGGGGFGSCFALGAAASSWSGGRQVVRLSEEHGFIEHGGEPVPIGTRALVFPNHSCPVVNLADRLVVLEPGRNPVFWAVAARGRTT